MLGSPFFIFVSSADLESDSPLSLINQAAQIAKSAGHKRADIEIVPVELFYDSWGANAAWGSDVDVFIGESICLSALTSDPRFMELGFTKQKFKELNTAKLSARIKDALLEMAGNNRFSRLSLSMARQLAHLAATDGRASYALCLSVIAQLPEHSPLVKSWDVFRGYCEDLGVWKVNGFPIFTTQELLPLVIETILSAIPAAADIFLNVPAFVFVFASLLIMKDKDADNRRRKRSVAFAASIVPWTVLLWYQFCLYGLPWLILPHLLITALGGYYTRLFRVGLAQIINSARHPELRGIYGRLRDELLGMIYRD
ncbi:hypothetical protein AGMMS50276_06260 [Synergistales bacterium]|nr:hypothetical protein AGMMS50276_06260 [Synergistales bacterium]